MMFMHPNGRYVTLLYFFLNEYGLTAVATDKVIVEIGSIDDHYLPCAFLWIAGGIPWLLEIDTTRVHLDEFYLLCIGGLFGVFIGDLHQLLV